MRLLTLICVFFLSLFGCSPATAKLQFSHGALGSAGQPLTQQRQGLGGRAPTTFGVKLLAVYLAEDVEPTTQNNIGRTEMIYLNPTCQEDISTCELSPGFNDYDHKAFTHFVTDYFDFAADSATVNAAINAQTRAITPGTYRYARMEFCKANQGHVANLRWADEDRVAHEVVWGTCGVTSAALSPVLDVQAGEAIAVTLSYDLSTAISDLGANGQVTGPSCSDSACFTPPTFQPSAARVTP